MVLSSSVKNHFLTSHFPLAHLSAPRKNETPAKSCLCPPSHILSPSHSNSLHTTSPNACLVLTDLHVAKSKSVLSALPLLSCPAAFDTIIHSLHETHPSASRTTSPSGPPLMAGPNVLCCIPVSSSMSPPARLSLLTLPLSTPGFEHHPHVNDDSRSHGPTPTSP